MKIKGKTVHKKKTTKRKKELWVNLYLPLRKAEENLELAELELSIAKERKEVSLTELYILRNLISEDDLNEIERIFRAEETVREGQE